MYSYLETKIADCRHVAVWKIKINGAFGYSRFCCFEEQITLRYNFITTRHRTVLFLYRIV